VQSYSRHCIYQGEIIMKDGLNQIIKEHESVVNKKISESIFWENLVAKT
jgi:hypothetical protein